MLALTCCRTQVVPLNNIHRTDSAHLNTSAERDSVRHLHFRSEKQLPGIIGQPDTVIIFDSIVNEHHHYHYSRDTIVINNTDTIDRPVPTPSPTNNPSPKQGRLGGVFSGIGIGVLITALLLLAMLLLVKR